MWIFEVICWSSYYKKCKKGEFQKSVFFIVNPMNSQLIISGCDLMVSRAR